MSDAQVRKLADGRVYTSRQALENGLIDALGYEEDAIGAATQLAGKAQVEVVRYERMHSLLEMLFARANASSTNAALDMLPAMTSPRPMYLWCPQAAELP
jgi:protease-4